MAAITMIINVIKAGVAGNGGGKRYTMMTVDYVAEIKRAVEVGRD